MIRHTGRARVGGHLDEVECGCVRDLLCLRQGHDAPVLPVRIDQTHRTPRGSPR